MSPRDRPRLGHICCVDGCLQPAAHRGHASVRTTIQGRHAATNVEGLTFELMFCDRHAAAVGEGGVLVKLDSAPDVRA
jgi:hypothetical protein